jgi:hypothetical protein
MSALLYSGIVISMPIITLGWIVLSILGIFRFYCCCGQCRQGFEDGYELGAPAANVSKSNQYLDPWPSAESKADNHSSPPAYESRIILVDPARTSTPQAVFASFCT